MRKFWLLFGMLAVSSIAYGQGIRIDSPLLVTGPNVPISGGPLPQALFLANATVTVCQHPATINSCVPITTYTDSTMGTSCPLYAQMTQLPGTLCTAGASPKANVGFWYAGGTIDYIVSSAYGTFGPYTISGVSGVGTFLPITGGTVCRMNGMLVAGSSCYPTIQSAVNAISAGTTGVVYMPPGTYTENIVISQSNITLQGAGIQATTLNPSGNTCAVTYSAGSSGSGINYNHMYDLSIANTSSTSDGVCFTGGANVPNDRFDMQRVSVVGFRYNLNFIGRSIWDNFTDDYFENATLTNVYKNSGSVENAIKFQNGRIGGAQQYGVYWNNSNTNADQGINFDHVNVEYNGASGTLANCAGIWLGGGAANTGGIGSGSITNGSYFEGNCITVPDSLGADIRLTGEYIQAFDITGGNLIWSTTNYGIYNDAVQTTGSYEGNNIPFGSVNRIYVDTINQFSNLHIGANFLNGGTNSINANNNNFACTHTETTSPFSDNECSAAGTGGYNPITSTSPGTNNTLNAQLADRMDVYNGPWTINTILGGSNGRVFKVYSQAGSLTLATGGVSPNAIFLMNSKSTEIVPAGGTATFHYSVPNQRWEEDSPSSGNQSTGITSLATTSPITGGTITTTGTIGCATCGVTGTGLGQFAATTSAAFLGVISDESGSGLVVGNNSPTLITPALGTPSAVVITNATGTCTSCNVGGNAATATSATSATTAGNLSGTPALPNGTTATTQSANVADAKLATDNTVLNAFATPPTAGYGSGTPEPVAATTITTTTGYRFVPCYSQGTAGSSNTHITIGGCGGTPGNMTTGTTAGALPVMWSAGTIIGFGISCATAPSGTDSVTIVKQASGASTISTTTMTLNLTTGYTVNTMSSTSANPVSLAAGDKWGLQISTSATETLSQCGAVIAFN